MIFDKTKHKFCGTVKVKSVTDTEENPDLKIILLENGVTFRAPVIILDKLLTEKADPEIGEDWRSGKLNLIAQDLLSLLRKVYFFSYGDLETLSNFMNTIVKNDIIIAGKVKWGKWEHNLTLQDIDDVIQSDPKSVQVARDEATANYLKQRTIKRG